MAEQYSSPSIKKLLNGLKAICSVSTEKVEYSWSHLPEELLVMIMGNLTDLSDLIRCRGVCHWWRSAAARKLCVNNHLVPPLLLQCTPYTVIFKKDYACIACNNNVWKKLFSTTKKDLEFGIYIPSPFSSGRTRYISSYRGWLLLLHVEDIMIGFRTPPPKMGDKTTEFTLSPFSSPHDPNEKRILHLFNPYTRILLRLPPPPPPTSETEQLRFVTSCSASDPDCIISVYGIYSSTVAFFRLRDRKWSPLFTISKYIVWEAIFFKGHFYAVDQRGVLRRLLFDFDCNFYEEEVVASIDIGDSNRCYLVESSSGSGVLMMVVRWFDFYAKNTNSFEIFKLDWSNGKWDEVRSLGDQALFLTHYGSKLVTVSVKENKYRRNTIYFVDNKNFGLYDLGNRKIQPLKLSSSYKMNFSFCGWFQPAV